MTSANLSRDIAGLVFRARNGESIDRDGHGEELAAKYPELGMSAELIGKAILRAADMVGTSLDGADAPAMPPSLIAAQPPDARL